MRSFAAVLCLLLCFSRDTLCANILSPIHRFGTNATSGVHPEDRLVLSANGFLYGITSSGGIDGSGTVYRVQPSGANYTILHHFSPSLLDGSQPLGGLTLDASAGVLFGATRSGGVNGLGTIFRINLDGSGYAILKSFNGTDGEAPQAAVTLGLNGVLYGTTYFGGANKVGTVFKINKDGSGFASLRSFEDASTDGKQPNAALVQDSNGVLYGTAYAGGNGHGTIFKLNSNGSGYSTLYAFNLSEGFFARGILLGSDGVLYGTLGASPGSLYKINRNGSGFAVLKAFGAFPEASEPLGTLLEGSDGFLYGTTSRGGANFKGNIFKLAKNGSGYSVVRDGTTGRDSEFYASLIEGPDGTLYGIATRGGTSDTGTVFKMQKDGGSHTVVKTFGPSDGVQVNGLMRSSDGALYGTCNLGGQNGTGTLFKLQGDGSGFTVLRSFPTDLGGAFPVGGVTEGPDGYLYGCTSQNSDPIFGTIYKVKKDGTDYTVLKGFPNTGGTVFPEGPLLLASDGALYGVSRFAGANFKGTIFKLNTDGTGFTELKSFAGSTLGETPDARLLEGSDGAIYGSAGVVFKINKNGSGYTVLKVYSSSSGPSNAESSIVEGSDGAIYGASRFIDGFDQRGSLFKLNKNGSNFSTVRVFEVAQGYLPETGLTKGANGSFYGSTGFGSTNASGMLYRTDGTGGNFTVLQALTEELAQVSLPLVYARATTQYGANLFSNFSRYGSIFRLELNATLQIAEGNQQRTPLQTPFVPIRVRALDSGGQPLSGVRVRFQIPNTGITGQFGGSAAFSNDIAGSLTDANGYATAPTLTANNLTGAFQLRASLFSSPDDFVDFTLYNVDFSLTDLAIPENSPVGTSAGTLFEIGASPGADSLVFSLVDGADSTDNPLFSINGLSVNTAANLNFEARASYKIRVRGTRPSGSSSEHVFTLSVQNANDAPTITGKQFSITENSPLGTAVGTLVSNDEDTGQILSYAISAGNADGVFGISATTGAITVVIPSKLNSETTPKYTLTVTVTDNAALQASASANAEILVRKANLLPPTATSGLNITPNPTSVGRPVTLSVGAIDPEGMPLTFSYAYGDGSTGTTLTHTYNAPSVYTVTATVSDGELTTVLTKEVLVLAAANPFSDIDNDGVPNSEDGDDDGDGISDEMELLAGSDPFDKASTPLTGNALAVTPIPLSIEKLSIQLNFAKANLDTIRISGVLPIPASFVPSEKTIVLNIGGVVKSFTLNAKGQSKTSRNEAFLLNVRKVRSKVLEQNASFTVFLRGTFGPSLAENGLKNTDTKQAVVQVQITALFDGQYLQSTENLLYSAKKGKTGRTR